MDKFKDFIAKQTKKKQLYSWKNLQNSWQTLMILVIYITSILYNNYIIQMLKLYGQINLNILQRNRLKKSSYIAGKTYKITGRLL